MDVAGELVNVLDVADRDALWQGYVELLAQAGVLVDDADAKDALRQAWFGERRFVFSGGPLTRVPFTLEQRRLLVAWTWPNKWGVSVWSTSISEISHNEAHYAGPDPGMLWAAEVRIRVRDVARRLDDWLVGDGVGILTAAAGLRPNVEAERDRIRSLKHGAEPLVASWLLELSKAATVGFTPQFTADGAWAFNQVALLGALVKGPDWVELRNAVDEIFESAPTDVDVAHRSVDGAFAELTAAERYDPVRFHKQLPATPPTDRKYWPLFRLLDQLTGTREFLLQDLAEKFPAEKAAGSRGPVKERLPDGARRPQFWANPTPREHPGLVKKPWARAWLAAGFRAHPLVTTRHGQRVVHAVRFEEMANRDLWWPWRALLRDDTYNPLTQLDS